MTLEELQEQVLKLKEEKENLTKENENLKTSVADTTKKVSELQEHNQKLFLRLTAEPEKKKEEEEKIPSIDELAEIITKGDGK